MFISLSSCFYLIIKDHVQISSTCSLSHELLIGYKQNVQCTVQQYWTRCDFSHWLLQRTPYWPGRRRSQQTRCSVRWTLLPALLATLGSSIAACRGYCKTNFTGSMSPTEYNSSSPCWCIVVYRCLHGTAPLYMTESCTQTADIVRRQHLRSASQWKMIVPRYRLHSYSRRCFAVEGPSTWNLLPDSLRDPALSLSIFRRQSLENTFCEILTRYTQCIRDFLWECAI